MPSSRGRETSLLLLRLRDVRFVLHSSGGICWRQLRLWGEEREREEREGREGGERQKGGREEREGRGGRKGRKEREREGGRMEWEGVLMNH